jgi:hypothetical protein
MESRDEPIGLHGIVVTDGRLSGLPSKPTPEPRISAFVWGGKVRPSPTLPFGRWKGSA